MSHEYKALLPIGVVSDKDARGSSSVLLLENDRELGPAHSLHHEINGKGEGAFLHYGNALYFSASDNSDPNTNGRSYSIRYQKSLPPFIYIAAIVIAYLTSVYLLWKIAVLLSKYSPRFSMILLSVLNVALVLAAVEASFWALTETRLAESGPILKRWYYSGLGEADKWSVATEFPGLSVNYIEHQYLNYCLNPEAAYCGIKQFNDKYKIRRKEEVRPREKVKWRAMVVGGSTTFGEGIPREEGTWPYQLELLIRKQCGDDCDVINCGVGGYTIVENIIHYIVLLRDLKPDLVILYTGINDVHARLFGNILTDYSNYRVPWRSEHGPYPKAREYLAWSQSYRYYFLNYAVLRAMDEGIAGRVSKNGPKPSDWAEALRRNSSQVYRDHLDDLIALLQSQKIKVAVLPQFFTVKNQRDEIFQKGVEEHNAVNKELAAAHNAPFASFLVDSSAFTDNLTFDNCHFNESGSKRMAELVFAFLKENNLIP
jgi:lysophospholipase L1-like esterase